MTHERFNEIVEEELKYIESLLVKKQAEYNLTADRFDSFKHAAGLTQWTPEQVLLGYLSKHLSSIIEMINSKEVFTEERWKEKITDSINYELLLLGLVEDTGKMSKKNN